jgi:hypothetical protein
MSTFISNPPVSELLQAVVQALATSQSTLAHAIFSTVPKPPCTERVLLLDGQSQYQALNYFTTYLQEAFLQRGHACERLCLYENTEAITKLDKLMTQFQPTLLLSFNGIHEHITMFNGKTLGQHHRIPSLSWLVDPFLTHMSRIKDIDYPTKINAHAFVDSLNPHTLKTLESSEALHASLRIAGYPHFPSIKAMKDREINLFVPCSFTPFQEKRDTLHFPRFPQFEKLCHDAIDYMIASSEHQADVFLLAGLERMGIDPRVIHAAHFPPIMAWIFHSAEMYWRENFLRQARNIPLTLCGNGWEKANFLSDKWTLKKPFPLNQLVEVYGNSRMVWHIFPMQPSSGHDRLFFATANGANVLTEAKQWLQANYGNRLSYIPQDLSGVEETLQDLLHQPIEAQALQAQEAQRFTLTHHTFLNRVLDIERLIEIQKTKQALKAEHSLALT